jgi:predicted dinucleotide-binding enzyme
MNMRIGIIGSGTVAHTLAKGLSTHGHSVMVGSRDPAKLAGLAKEAPAVQTGTMEDAAGFAELAILAVKGTAAEAALGLVGGRLAGKTLIDATNPIADQPPVNGVLQFFTGPNDSLGERLQRAFPEVKLVKAFNSVGAPVMINPSFGSERPTMFIAGNDGGAKQAVSTLLESLGWEALDMGAIEAARAIEPLCQLWCIPGFLRNDWVHAFRWLRPR